MIWCKCLNKIRDKNGIITDYEIASISGERRIVPKNQLKAAIANQQVALVNLELSKDGKLIDRAAEKEAQLTKNLTSQNLDANTAQQIRDKDNNITAKANMLGLAVSVDEYGNVTSIPNAMDVVVTPAVKRIGYIGHEGFKDKRVTITGSENINFDPGTFWNAELLKIKNPTVLTAVSDNRLSARNIMLDFDGIDQKTLDIIFKTYKTECDLYSGSGVLTNIMINSSRLDKDIAIDRVTKILLRQKPSGVTERRAYDLVTYLRLIKTLNSSYGIVDVKELTAKYLDELDSKFNAALHGYNGAAVAKHRTFLSAKSGHIQELCEELKGAL